MKTTVIGSKGVETPVSKVGNGTTANVADNSGNGQKINNLPVSKQFDDKKDEPKKEEPKAEAPATPAKQEEQPKQQAEEPKAEEAQTEPSKKELKEQLKEQQERKLTDTVKMVEALGKMISQRNKLDNTIANIDGFNIAQNDDKDDMASDSRFAHCELVISDDDGNEFVTKNPFIIAYVAQEVRTLCVEKLKEAEARIVIPF